MRSNRLSNVCCPLITGVSDDVRNTAQIQSWVERTPPVQGLARRSAWRYAESISQVLQEVTKVSHARGQGHVKISTQLNSERRMTDFTNTGEVVEVVVQQTKSCKQPVYIRKVSVVKVQHYKCLVQVDRGKAREHKEAQHFVSSQAVFKAEICWVIKITQLIKLQLWYLSRLWPDVPRQWDCQKVFMWHSKSSWPYMLCLGSLLQRATNQRYKKSTVLCFIFWWMPELTGGCCSEALEWTWREGCGASFWLRVRGTHSSREAPGKQSREPCHHLIPISSYRCQWMALLSTGSCWGYSKRTKAKDDQFGKLWFTCCSWKFSRWRERNRLEGGRCFMTHQQDKLTKISSKVLCPSMGWRLSSCWAGSRSVASCRQYISSHQKLPKSKVPSSASFCTVKGATADSSSFLHLLLDS